MTPTQGAPPTSQLDPRQKDDLIEKEDEGGKATEELRSWRAGEMEKMKRWRDTQPSWSIRCLLRVGGRRRDFRMEKRCREK